MAAITKAELAAQIGRVRKSLDRAKAKNAALGKSLAEALEQQSATSQIFRVISSSPGDLEPTFQTILASATRFCAAHLGLLYRYDGNAWTAVAFHGADPAFVDFLSKGPIRPGPKTALARLVVERRPIHITDILADEAYQERDPLRIAQAELGKARTLVAVPMHKENQLLGAIVIYRPQVRPFTDRQIDLVRTFADQAVIAMENVRLFHETKEALEHQKASADILRVISSSPTDLSPVMAALAESAARLCEATDAHIWQREGDELQLVASHGPLPIKRSRLRIGRDSVTGRAAFDCKLVHVHDLAAVFDDEFPDSRAMMEGGYRSVLAVPLVREGSSIGAILLRRTEVRPFTAKQLALLQTFADQAVIAIENVRLFNETKEALERQTATAEILKVISSSPSDVQPVFEVIAESAIRLLRGWSVHVCTFDGERMYFGAARGALPDTEQYVRQRYPTPLNADWMTGRCIIGRTAINVSDCQADPSPRQREFARQRGYRAALAVPMLRDGQPIGAIAVTRETVGAFAEAEVGMLQTFADQAAIAIENVRLFNETKEALERQTATAEILRVISSSPTDVQPVFDIIARNAVALCGGLFANVFRYDGKLLHYAASHQVAPEQVEVVKQGYPRPPDRGRVAGRAILSKSVACIEDALADPDYDHPVAAAAGWRRMFAAPMLREGEPLGAIAVGWAEPGPIPKVQEELLKTFADQAAIAIENVRLFNETKEALERQTATAEILKVISSSPTSMDPVFAAILSNATTLCEANLAALWLYDGEYLIHGAAHNASPEFVEFIKGNPQRPGPEGPARRAAFERRPVHVVDLPADPSFKSRTLHLTEQARTVLAVPLLRETVLVGVIILWRRDVRAFTDKQIALLQTFADQAVIAIENVRLFKELEARTAALTKSVQQLTALGEVGQAISSTLDLETVLKTIVSRALQLTGLDAGEIFEYDDRTKEFHLWAAENLDGEIVEALRRTPMRKGEGAVGRTAVTGEPTEIPEILDASYQSRVRELLVASGLRALLAVPLLREDRFIGAIVVNRKTPGPFAPETVELLKTFATQSALAIQNARLFREIAEKSRQLEVASRHKSDFLASMSHELRTPLNAILGFNEMILGEVYGAVPPDMKEPLADIQTSGKHLLRLINNVLDLAKIEAGRMELALADYSVQDTVESVRTSLRPLAADKGLEFAVSVPNDIPLAYGDAGRITQCLMNLAGNSLKFTKAGKVEISVERKDGLLSYRVSDTGIGISPDKIETVFSEFRQSDATIASEYGGTGLGLSITKKFIEMHGGRIWVESEPGKGSVFIFEIPLRAGEAAS